MDCNDFTHDFNLEVLAEMTDRSTLFILRNILEMLKCLSNICQYQQAVQQSLQLQHQQALLQQQQMMMQPMYQQQIAQAQYAAMVSCAKAKIRDLLPI